MIFCFLVQNHNRSINTKCCLPSCYYQQTFKTCYCKHSIKYFKSLHITIVHIILNKICVTVSELNLTDTCYLRLQWEISDSNISKEISTKSNYRRVTFNFVNNNNKYFVNNNNNIFGTLSLQVIFLYLMEH